MQTASRLCRVFWKIAYYFFLIAPTPLIYSLNDAQCTGATFCRKTFLTLCQNLRKKGKKPKKISTFLPWPRGRVPDLGEGVAGSNPRGKLFIFSPTNYFLIKNFYLLYILTYFRNFLNIRKPVYSMQFVAH